MVPLLGALLAVSINSPSDSWRSAWDAASGHLSQLTVLIDVVVALLAAWEAGRFRRSGLARLEASALRTEFWRLLGVMVSSALLGIAALVLIVVYSSFYVVGGGHPWVAVFLEDALAIVTFATWGTALGAWWTSRLAAPLAAVSTYGWLVYGSSVLVVGRPQSLFPAALSGVNCCAFTHSMVGRTEVATAGWQLGIIGGLLCSMYMRSGQRTVMFSWARQFVLGAVAVLLVVAGGTLVVVDGGSPTSAIRSPMAEACLHQPDGFEICDYAQLSYLLSKYQSGIEVAVTQVPESWIPHRLIPLPATSVISVSRGTGYLAAVSVEPWTLSAEQIAVGVANSYFHLMMSCRSGLHGPALQELQRDTELASVLVANRVSQTAPGSLPFGVPYPASLVWAPWATQRQFISNTLARIWECRADYFN